MFGGLTLHISCVRKDIVSVGTSRPCSNGGAHVTGLGYEFLRDRPTIVRQTAR